MKILITGKNGQLGNELQKIASNYRDFEFIFLDRKACDLSSTSSIENALEQNKPNIIINAGAYTNVNKAEEETKLANQINGYALETIADWCAKNKCKLIHFSTDYVFNGESQIPYSTDDRTDPINAYGASKRIGEEFILQSKAQAIIIRTSWVFSSYGNNFVKTMLHLAQSKDELSVVDNQFGCPTYAKDLAETCLAILQQAENWQESPQIFHYTNAEKTNWFEFAKEIFLLKNISIKVSPVSDAAFPSPAKRPKYSVMNTEKIQQHFHLHIRNWQEALEECLLME